MPEDQRSDLRVGLPSHHRLARGGDFIHAAGAGEMRRLQHHLRIVSISFAIEIIASMNRSSSCLPSVSVGSIISAPCTISGKLTVYGWKP